MKGDALFDSSARGLREVGASTDDRDLVELITSHGRQETERLLRYEEVAQRSSPAMRYLMELIVEDERRHHRLLAEIADAIAWGTVPTPQSGVPRPGSEDADAELVAETKELLTAEKEDRAELRRLRRRLRASYTGTLWPLLVEVMLHDTDKHVHILDYIVKHRGR